MTMKERIESYLGMHGETKWVDLAQAMRMADETSMRQLRQMMHDLTWANIVTYRVDKGLTYYRLRT
jgi:hypothetical protein